MNRQELLKDFSGRLLQIRESLGVSKKKMAGYLATEQNNYSRYEKAGSFPNFLGLYAISRNIGISLEWLVCGTGPMYSEYSKEKEPGAAPEPVKETGKSGGSETGEMPPVRAGEPGKPIGEIETLVEYMERIPYLRHEILVSFYKFLDEHKELVDSPPPPRR